MGRAVVSRTENPSSNPTADKFFLIFRICGRRSFPFFCQKSSAFAEDGGFFLPKKAPHFFEHLLHKLQIR